MAFADPTNLTINTVVTAFAKTTETPTSTLYVSSDESTEVLITQEKTKAGRRRRKFRITNYKIVADPLITGTNDRESASMEFILDEPESGWTDIELGHFMSALTGAMNDSTIRGKFLTSQH